MKPQQHLAVDMAEIKRLKDELDACHKAYEQMAERASGLQRRVAELQANGLAHNEQIMGLQAALAVLQAEWNAQAPRLMAVRGFLAQLRDITEAEQAQQKIAAKRAS